ncbi:HAD family hydrolase [Bacillaceae bacterium W0354]
MQNIDSIILDLDGTIWDTLDIVTESWNQILKENGLNQVLTIDDIRSVTGQPFDKLVKKLLPQLSTAQQKMITEQTGILECQKLSKRGGKLYDHVEDTLQKLAEKYPLALVSNCQKEYMDAFFDYHKLDRYFVDAENPGRTGLSKSENIKLVMDRNQLNNPVYVGDTSGDLQAAREAGIPFVYASYGFEKLDTDSYSIDNFKELLNIF